MEETNKQTKEETLRFGKLQVVECQRSRKMGGSCQTGSGRVQERKLPSETNCPSSWLCWEQSIPPAMGLQPYALEAASTS